MGFCSVGPFMWLTAMIFQHGKLLTHRLLSACNPRNGALIPAGVSTQFPLARKL